MMPSLALCVLIGLQPITVRSLPELRDAAARAKPGTTILIAPGTYPGGLHLSDLHGTKDKPITIAGAERANPPKFTGGNSGIQLSRVSHVELRDLSIEKVAQNGLNIDDGGTITKPSHHVILRNILVSDLPNGNHDGIKLSGLDDFVVENCGVKRWGGSGVDMVGCHRGIIKRSLFEEGGDSGVQAKGGSSDILIFDCRFTNAGQRSINLGGSTGEPYFRPSLAAMGKSKYEAKNLTVEECKFTGSSAPIAFVGVDGAIVNDCDFVNPGRWVIRILQETSAQGFVPCRNGVFSGNRVTFLSTQWFSGGVNIGPGTAPETFVFEGNRWLCSDKPELSRPNLPTKEIGGIYGKSDHRHEQGA